jgi:hypothetical protein
MASVYRKTAKGLSEIETRANRLVPRLRTSLILVDGRRSDDDLRALIAGDAVEVLGALLADGYIEVIASTPPPRAAPPAAAPPPVPAAAGASPRKFEELRRMAVRYLNDQMGPSGESVALKIEKAQNVRELTAQLETATQYLRASRGEAVAREFAARFLEQPPT